MLGHWLWNVRRPATEMLRGVSGAVLANAANLTESCSEDWGVKRTSQRASFTVGSAFRKTGASQKGDCEKLGILSESPQRTDIL